LFNNIRFFDWTSYRRFRLIVNLWIVCRFLNRRLFNRRLFNRRLFNRRLFNRRLFNRRLFNWRLRLSYWRKWSNLNSSKGVFNNVWFLNWTSYRRLRLIVNLWVVIRLFNRRFHNRRLFNRRLFNRRLFNWRLFNWRLFNWRLNW
jgi:hypothetical protein